VAYVLSRLQEDGVRSAGRVQFRGAEGNLSQAIQRIEAMVAGGKSLSEKWDTQSFHAIWDAPFYYSSPRVLRHGCGYALANADHDTRALQAWY
jgi:hypothetical protein